MGRRELLTEVIDYLDMLADRAVSLDKDRALTKKLYEASSDEERYEICRKFTSPPPPSSLPEETPITAAIILVQNWLRELGVTFPDPPEAVVQFFKEKDAVNKLLPS